MVIAYLSLLVAIIGLVTYALASNAKVTEVGRLLFFAGLLVTLWSLQGHTVKL